MRTCYTEIAIHSSSAEHRLVNGVQTAEQGWEVSFCTLKSKTQITAGYTRNHFNTTPSALQLQLPFYNEASSPLPRAYRKNSMCTLLETIGICSSLARY